MPKGIFTTTKIHQSPWACPSWEVKWLSIKQKRPPFPHNLQDPSVHYGVHKRELLVPILRQIVTPSHPFLTFILMFSSKLKYTIQRKFRFCLPINDPQQVSTCWSVFQFILPYVKIPNNRTTKQRKKNVESMRIKTSHLQYGWGFVVKHTMVTWIVW